MSHELKKLEIKPEELLLLEQPTLRMPYAISRHSFKTAQRALEHEVPKLVKEYAAIQKASVAGLNSPKEGERGGDVEMTEAGEGQSEAAAPPSTDPSAVLAQTDALLSKLRALKQNLADLHAKEQKATQASKARLNHLQQLYEFNSVMDVRYEKWSKTRLARLEVDYLLREGHIGTAQMLSGKWGIGELVDIDACVEAGQVERSLREEHDTNIALKWCKDNAQMLKKMMEAQKLEDVSYGAAKSRAGSDGNSNGYSNGNSTPTPLEQRQKEEDEVALAKMKQHGLEFELRLQQCIEMARRAHDSIRTGLDMPLARYEAWVKQAQAHARKHLAADLETLGVVSSFLVVPDAGGAVDAPISNTSTYKGYYSVRRWNLLASLFTYTYNALYNLPQRPMLAAALSAGLSALKTPACHSTTRSPSANATTAICPVCSVELNTLAKQVPYAHHIKSRVEDYPVALPNGRIYGRERLKAFNEKAGTQKGWVRDPMGAVVGVEGEMWREEQVKKVFVP